MNYTKQQIKERVRRELKETSGSTWEEFLLFLKKNTSKKTVFDYVSLDLISTVATISSVTFKATSKNLDSLSFVSTTPKGGALTFTKKDISDGQIEIQAAEGSFGNSITLPLKKNNGDIFIVWK